MQLRELKFSDLMIMSDGSSYLRHAEGYLGPVTPMPVGYHAEVAEIRKELELKSENEFYAEFNQVPYRVTRINSLSGHGYFLRRPVFPVPNLESLGIHPLRLAMYRDCANKQGLMLFAGATGSGKTTTAYSLLQEYVTQQGDIIIAVEDPPELPMQGSYGENDKGLWYQIDVNKAGGFQLAMIAAMRYNPRFIFIGEIRAPEVANEALRAAVNGHLVLATIHSNSVIGAVMALQQLAAASMGSSELSRSILADGLLCVTHQKLVKDNNNIGRRKLESETLYFGDKPGIKSSLRSGRMELLSNDIESQRIMISRGMKVT